MPRPYEKTMVIIWLSISISYIDWAFFRQRITMICDHSKGAFHMEVEEMGGCFLTGLFGLGALLTMVAAAVAPFLLA
jgi:hypothetical protein